MDTVTITLTFQEIQQLIRAARASIELMKKDFRHNEDRFQLESVVYQLEGQLKSAAVLSQFR